MQLYMDAAASFWREWIINYDASHQRTLAKDAANNSRRFFDEARRWIARQHRALLRTARRTHEHMIHFPVRWLGGIFGFAALLFTLLNLPRVIRGLRNRSLRAHPERAQEIQQREQECRDPEYPVHAAESPTCDQRTP